MTSQEKYEKLPKFFQEIYDKDPSHLMSTNSMGRRDALNHLYTATRIQKSFETVEEIEQGYETKEIHDVLNSSGYGLKKSVDLAIKYAEHLYGVDDQTKDPSINHDELYKNLPEILKNECDRLTSKLEYNAPTFDRYKNNNIELFAASVIIQDKLQTPEAIRQAEENGEIANIEELQKFNLSNSKLYNATTNAILYAEKKMQTPYEKTENYYPSREELRDKLPDYFKNRYDYFLAQKRIPASPDPRSVLNCFYGASIIQDKYKTEDAIREADKNGEIEKLRVIKNLKLGENGYSTTLSNAISYANHPKDDAKNVEKSDGFNYNKLLQDLPDFLKKIYYKRTKNNHMLSEDSKTTLKFLTASVILQNKYTNYDEIKKIQFNGEIDNVEEIKKFNLSDNNKSLAAMYAKDYATSLGHGTKEVPNFNISNHQEEEKPSIFHAILEKFDKFK